jgi:Asp-tRNA(Asn)/Glu-tRNA(Gln) amidotransferase A subunit family amidase
VQIIARPWEEELALGIAETVEKAGPGWRVPPIC